MSELNECGYQNVYFCGTNSSNSAPKRVPQNRKKRARFARPIPLAGGPSRPCLASIRAGKGFFLSSINLARGQKKQNCFFFHQPRPSSQKDFLDLALPLIYYHHFYQVESFYFESSANRLL